MAGGKGQKTMIQRQVDDIIKKNPKPANARTAKAIHRLEYMRNFYVKKVELAPEGQKPMFNGFIWACGYAISQLQAHSNLTAELEKLKGDNDENRTDSKS